MMMLTPLKGVILILYNPERTKVASEQTSRSGIAVSSAHEEETLFTEWCIMVSLQCPAHLWAMMTTLSQSLLLLKNHIMFLHWDKCHVSQECGGHSREHSADWPLFFYSARSWFRSVQTENCLITCTRNRSDWLDVEGSWSRSLLKTGFCLHYEVSEKKESSDCTDKRVIEKLLLSLT